MKFGVVVFPGTNCDRDCYNVLKNVIRQDVEYVWFKDKVNWDDYGLIVLPGGFSYGDYLRPAAIARFAPALEGLSKYVEKGGLVLGICNGFQMLLELGLLPGAMIRNNNLQFICKDVFLKIDENDSPFLSQYEKGQIISLPIAHADGHYYIDDDGLKALQSNGQIVLRYCDDEGRVNQDTNPNGSIKGIAGLCNKDRNVLGLMPHPERASEEILGGSDGFKMFDSIVRFLDKKNK